MNLGWPDILIVLIVAVSMIRSFQNGFVRELSGAIALLFAVITPWFYNGSLDPQIERITHLGSGSAHVIGMFLTAAITYGIVVMLAWVLDRIARLPLLGTVNAVAGAAIGVFKAALFCWLVLYIALFFPLSPDLRSDLHHSPLVTSLTSPDPRIDAVLYGTFPWFAKPFMLPFFNRHHA